MTAVVAVEALSELQRWHRCSLFQCSNVGSKPQIKATQICFTKILRSSVLQRDSEIEMGNAFNQTNTISAIFA